MKTRMYLIGILVLSTIVISSCTGNASAPQTSAQSGSASDSWKFYVLGVRSSTTDPDCNSCKSQFGWQYALIDLAVENAMNIPSWFPGTFYASGSSRKDDTAELTDTGGFQRVGRSRGIEAVGYGQPQNPDQGFMIWPNFRVRFTFFSEIPQNQSVDKLTLKFAGRSYTLDLQKPNPNLKTPFDTTPNWKAKNVGESFEIPRDVRMRVTNATIVEATSLSKYKDEYYKGKAGFAATLEVENTGGFNLYLRSAVSRIYAFDDSGHFGVGDLAINETLPPGRLKNVQAQVAFSYSVDSVKAGWLVFCLSSNPANPTNKQNTEQCEIYQVK
ncbi:MAG: hypothetical protein HY070_02835 [Chloroflexi bacterium]|nr:hypothetical protein [Chloroflexota bacterium]MBI3742036.1 hypothetical protein [Chloroflexota bacterium]